jgi:hypothetical protein
MHIGIDDVGTFSSGTKFGFIAAALVRPGRSEDVRELLKSWETRVPNEYRRPSGEIKGHALPDAMLLEFVDEVMFKADPPLRYECLGVELVPETFHAAQEQRRRTAEQIAAGIERYRSQGDQFRRIANTYGNMLGWWSNITDENVLKLILQSHVIVDTLNFAIQWSVANEFDEELGDLQFKLDEGFLSTSEDRKRFWKDLLRSHIWQATYTGGGLVSIKEWTDEHPFNKTFIEKDLADDKAELTHEFKNRIQFYKSHETFEIRLADIVGTIVRREKITDQFAHLHTLRKGWRLIRLSGEEANVPSPYEG